MITNINCDGEFNTLIDEVNYKLNITMNYILKGEHVTEAERNNCTIGERIQDCVEVLGHGVHRTIESFPC